MTLRKILVATDFSEAATLAVRAAARLAVTLGAELTLAYAFDPFPVVAAATSPTAVWPALDISDSQHAFANREFAALAEDILAEVPHETAALPSANAADAICRHADENEVDLVVVGARGQGVVERLFLGSVAEKVVRHAPCSVLAMRSWNEEFPAHILAGTDLSPYSRAALDVTKELADAFDSRVSVVQVLNQKHWDQATGSSDRRTVRAIEAHMRDALADFSHDALGDVVMSELTHRESAPGGLVARASELGADLIAVGTHGRNGIKRFLIGSVAERVLRSASCAVIVARPARS